MKIQTLDEAQDEELDLLWGFQGKCVKEETAPNVGIISAIFSLTEQVMKLRHHLEREDA